MGKVSDGGGEDMKLGGGVLGRGGLEGRKKERKLGNEEDDEAAMDEVCGLSGLKFIPCL